MRQKQALTVMMEGHNVFLTGAPGAGKTYVLQEFIREATTAGKRIAVTASTGIAASHLGGTTIHSWSGLGILDALSQHDIDRLVGSEKLVKRFNATDVLVIDEISMLHGYRLDMVNQIAKVLRANDKPFGGLQIILVGDLFQLPPVSRGSQVEDFVHLAESWAELDLRVCYITEQHRQNANDGLLDLLEAMRSGDLQDYHGNMLRERLATTIPDDKVLTRLYAHNLDVDALNQQELIALSSDGRSYEMLTKGSKGKVEQLVKGLLVPVNLTLKIGAEIMFVANNYAEGFANGSRGTVIDFEYGLPVVRLVTGKEFTVDYHTWSLSEDNQVRAEVKQLPLRLAWAITIHKSQGMSLDAAQIDLSRAFTPGMGYVALSRIRSLDGLYLKGVNRVALTMHPHMHEFDSWARTCSQELGTTIVDYEAPPANSPKGGIKLAVADTGLLTELKQWRTDRAEADRVAPYMIVHNKTIEALAISKPTNEQQLLGVAGFGKHKVDRYGEEILSVIKGWS